MRAVLLWCKIIPLYLVSIQKKYNADKHKCATQTREYYFCSPNFFHIFICHTICECGLLLMDTKVIYVFLKPIYKDDTFFALSFYKHVFTVWKQHYFSYIVEYICNIIVSYIYVWLVCSFFDFFFFFNFAHLFRPTIEVAYLVVQSLLRRDNIMLFYC